LAITPAINPKTIHPIITNISCSFLLFPGRAAS
jgi:hypothetical protein